VNIDLDVIKGLSHTLPEETVPHLTLKRAGHRIWKVCSAASSAKPAAMSAALCAEAREFACQLIAAGIVETGVGPAEDQYDLALQWGVTGKSWLDLAVYLRAVHCLTQSSAAWDAFQKDGTVLDANEAETLRLYETALHTQLWMSTALAHTGSFDQAFVALSKAASVMTREPRFAAVSQRMLLHACRDQAVMLRDRRNPRLAADVLILACSVLPSEHPGIRTQSQHERSELQRLLSLCHSDLHDHVASAACAREAVRLEASGSHGHAKSLRVLFAALCVLEAGKQTDSDPPSEELYEQAMEFMLHREAKLSDSLEICRDLADRGLHRACFGCLARLRSHLHDRPEDLGSVWLFGAQLLASQIEEGQPSIDKSHICENDVAIDQLSILLDEVEAAATKKSVAMSKLTSFCGVWQMHFVEVAAQEQQSTGCSGHCPF